MCVHSLLSPLPPTLATARSSPISPRFLLRPSLIRRPPPPHTPPHTVSTLPRPQQELQGILTIRDKLATLAWTGGAAPVKNEGPGLLLAPTARKDQRRQVLAVKQPELVQTAQQSLLAEQATLASLLEEQARLQPVAVDSETVVVPAAVATTRPTTRPTADRRACSVSALHPVRRGNFSNPPGNGAERVSAPRWLALPPSEAPVITVITPVQDTSAVYMRAMERALFAQTFQLFRWVVVDDGSTLPETLKILDEYRARARGPPFRTDGTDGRTMVTRCDPAGLAACGPSRSRNWGVRHALAVDQAEAAKRKKTDQRKSWRAGAPGRVGAAGKAGAKDGLGGLSTPYVIFLDDDDLFERTYLETLVWALESTPQFAYANTYLVGFGANEFIAPQNWFNDNRYDNHHVISCLIRTEALVSVAGRAWPRVFDETWRTGGEDWLMWGQLKGAGFHGTTVPEALFWYRFKRKRRDWSWVDKSPEDAAAALKQHRANLKARVPALYAQSHWTNAKMGDFQCTHPGACSFRPPVAFANRHPRRPAGCHHAVLIIPWVALGGADQLNINILQLLTALGTWTFTVVCMFDIDGEASISSSLNFVLPKVQQYTEDILVLPHFVAECDRARFLLYLLKSRNADVALFSNAYAGYLALPYLQPRLPDVAFVDLVHMREEWKPEVARLGIGGNSALTGGMSRLSVEASPFFDATIYISEDERRWAAKQAAYYEAAQAEANTEVIPSVISRRQAKDLAGEHWNADIGARFDIAAEDHRITRDQWNSIIGAWGGRPAVGARSSGAGGVGGEGRRVVVYAGVDTSTTSQTDARQAKRAAIRQEFSIDEDEVCVLFAGRLVHQKRPLVMISAFHRFLVALEERNSVRTARREGGGVERASGRRRRAARLIVAGDGILLEQMENYATTNGIQDAVQFMGKMSHFRMLDVIYAGDILLMPSQNEGIPVSMIEAIAAGVVPVATDVGGVSELVVEGVGFLHPLGDDDAIVASLLRLGDDGEVGGGTALRKQMSVNGRAHVEKHFSMSSMQRGVDKALRSAIERRAQSVARGTWKGVPWDGLWGGHEKDPSWFLRKQNEDLDNVRHANALEGKNAVERHGGLRMSLSWNDNGDDNAWTKRPDVVQTRSGEGVDSGLDFVVRVMCMESPLSTYWPRTKLGGDGIQHFVDVFKEDVHLIDPLLVCLVVSLLFALSLACLRRARPDLVKRLFSRCSARSSTLDPKGV